jgi:hypothetical protein
MPREPYRQRDDRDYDQQHEHGRDDDEIALLSGYIACGAQNLGFARPEN